MTDRFADLRKYFLTLTPKTDAEKVDLIRDYLNSSNDITFNQLRKRMTEAAKPYDYDEIRTDVANKFNIDLDIKTIKSLLLIYPALEPLF